MMEAVRTSETSVNNHFTRQYNPEDSSEHQIQSIYAAKAFILTKICSQRVPIMSELVIA
jgi:hypothetical protein